MENSAKNAKAPEHASGLQRSPVDRSLGRKTSILTERREPLAQRSVPNGRNHPALLTPPFLDPSPVLVSSPQSRIAVSPDEVNYFSTLPDSPPRDPPSPRIQIFSEDDQDPSSEFIGGAFQSAMQEGGLDSYVFPLPTTNATGSPSTASDANSPTIYTPSLLLSPPLVVPTMQQDQTNVRSKRRPPAIIAPAYNLEVDGQLPPGTTIPTPAPSPRLRRFYPLDPSTSPLPSPSPEQGSFPFLACPSPSFLSPGLPSPALSMSGHPPSENGSISPRLPNISEPFSRLAAGLTKRTRRTSNDSTQCDLPLARSPSLPSPGSPSLSAPTLIRRPSFTSSNSEKEQEKAREVSRDRQKVKGKHFRGFSWIDRPDETWVQVLKRWVGGWRGRVLGMVVLTMLGYMIFSNSTSPQIAEPVNIRRRQIHSAHGRLRRGDLGRSFIHPDVVNPHHRRTSPISFSLLLAIPYQWSRKLIAAPAVSWNAVTRLRSAPDVAAAQSKKSTPPTASSHRSAVVEHPALPAPLVHADSANRDTLVLYRILGNDLPPRHSPGQTLRNLRFLLQYESDFSTLPHVGPHPVHHSHVYGSGSHSNELHSAEGGLRVDKYFVLNRIADKEMLDAIRGLLRLYSVPDSRVLVIPFEWEEYQKREFRWDGGVDKLSCWGVGSGPTSPPAAGPGSFALGKNSMANQAWKVADIAVEDAGTFDPAVAALRAKKKATLASLRALDYMYHDKNLYAMNNNGGRNFALEHGRTLANARWILPLDGNSFLTPAAMDSIVKTLSISGEGPTATRYLVIPMARLLANEHVIANNSIALVPKHTHEGGSAATDAELHHAPDAAPLVLEEPQVGFRFDATESYQPEMRYGRRSKLELLWRLGAIPYSRGLDRRSFPWEFSDRRHVTEASWGSIPGVAGLAVDSPVHQPPSHQPHVGFEPWNESSPQRGPLAFSKAGWVYRLFSGDRSQEEISPEAVTLRNTNRIKGIVAFLERLDEKVARGVGECSETGGCGFTSDRLWSFDHLEMERLRQKHKAGLVDSVDKVDAFETVAMDVHISVKKLTDHPGRLVESDAQLAATNASILALAGYLTGNSSYSTLATELINSKFIKPTPLFYRQGDQRAQMQRYQHKNQNGASTIDEEGVGYAFPPPPVEAGLYHTWSSPTADDGPPLPFNPLTFDPTLLLDSFKVLALPNSPQADAHSISRKSINSIFVAQLSYLLHAPDAIALSQRPDTPDIGAHHDAKIAALAAFFNDAKLLGRIANRGRLRLPRRSRPTGVSQDTEKAKEVHWRLIRGLAMVKLRPYNLVSNVVESWSEPPFDILGL